MKWEEKTIGEICNVISGGTPKRSRPDYWGGDISWVKISDMLQREIIKTEETITLKGLNESSAKLLEPGTLLLSIFATIGRTAVIKVPAATNQAIVGLKITSNIVSRDYLLHYLKASEKRLKFLSRGIAQDNINTTILKNFPVIIPPLDEQRRISKILDTLSSIEININKRNVLIEDLESSFFKNDFENNRYLSSKKKVTISDIVLDQKSSIRTGPFGSQLLKSEFKESGITVLGIDNAVENKFKWTNKRFISIEKYNSLSRFKVYPGDVLITIMGTCGRVCIVPEDIGIAINTKHLCAITLDQNLCLPEFLRAYFLYSKKSKTHLRSQTKGAIMDGLNMGIIKSLPIELPSIETQRRFVEKLIYKRRIKEKFDIKFDKFLELKGSISKQLLDI